MGRGGARPPSALDALRRRAAHDRDHDRSRLAVHRGRCGPAGSRDFVQILAGLAMRRPILRTLHAADRPARDLDVLSHILEMLERETFSSPRLRDLRRRLEIEGCVASTAIRRLHRLMELHDWEHNAIFVPIAATLQWGTHLAWAIEAWRTRHGVHVRRWLEAVAEVEALASLAAYRYEHPGDPFPEIVDGPATLRGRAARASTAARGAHGLQ